MEIKFKKGDRVIFRPKHAKYAPIERNFTGHIGTIMDECDLPNVRFQRIIAGMGDVLTADQRDLVLA